MAFHFMVIMSHYHKGVRVGWHYASEEKLDKDYLNDFMMNLKRKCGDVQFGVHKLSTNSLSIASVIEKDQFFEDVIFTEDPDIFIEYVTSDQTLTALDVSKLLLSIWPSSHLKLQKLLYYCYAEFLKRTGSKLFEEPIVSYKYGPVVESVFKEFTPHGSSIIDYEEDGQFIISPKTQAATPSFIKTVTSENGAVAVDCVIDVIKKYGDETPYDLVNRTHKKGGPWDRVYSAGRNREITDDSIIQYHYLVE